MLDSIVSPTDIRELETKMCGGFVVRCVRLLFPQLCDVHDLQCDDLRQSKTNSSQFKRGQSREANRYRVRYRGIYLYSFAYNTVLDVRARITENSS